MKITIQSSNITVQDNKLELFKTICNFFGLQYQYKRHILSQENNNIWSCRFESHQDSFHSMNDINSIAAQIKHIMQDGDECTIQVTGIEKIKK